MCYKRRYIIAVLFCLCLVFPAWAEQLPKHLAAFGSDLNRKLASQVGYFEGSKEEKAALDEAMRLLKKAGVPQWSAQNIRIEKGAEQLAKPLGLDLSNAKEWATLSKIIAQDDNEQRNQQIDALTEKAKASAKEGDEAKKQQSAENEKRAEYDRAQAAIMDTLSRRYGVKIGAHGKLNIAWNPDGQTLRMSISGRITEDDPKSEFLVTMMGHVTPELVAKGNHIAFVVTADKPGLNVLPPEALQEIRASIFGEWVTSKGARWVISKVSGSEGREAAKQRKEKISRNVEDDKAELKKLKNEKVYLWKDQNGKVIRQTKFKKLDERYHYEGEQPASEDTQKRIAELEKRIKEDSAAIKAKPVDQTDPLGRRYNPTDEEAQPLNINVTYENGYSFTYRTADFDGQRITADRTLYDRSDITDLPMDVIDGLIASWSPPEWIELEVMPNPETNEITLEGVRWRMHVTYSYGAFGMGPLEIQSIHTPYSKPLILTRKGMKTAPGAAENIDW